MGVYASTNPHQSTRPLRRRRRSAVTPTVQSGHYALCAMRLCRGTSGERSGAEFGALLVSTIFGPHAVILRLSKVLGSDAPEDSKRPRAVTTRFAPCGCVAARAGSEARPAFEHFMLDDLAYTGSQSGSSKITAARLKRTRNGPGRSPRVLRHEYTTRHDRGAKRNRILGIFMLAIFGLTQQPRVVVVMVKNKGEKNRNCGKCTPHCQPGHGL